MPSSARRATTCSSGAATTTCSWLPSLCTPPALAVLVCALPVLFGFVLPVLFMLHPLIGGVPPEVAWRYRRLAVENLKAAFPLRTDTECRAITRQMFSHFGRLLMVLLKFSTLTPQQMQHVMALLLDPKSPVNE